MPERLSAYHRAGLVMGIALILCSIFPGNAQVVMNGPDATTCNDTFTDSNPNGNYSTNESDTLVICPDMVNGNQVRVTFTAFDVQPGDVLTAYEGPNVGGGFIGNFDNNNSLLGTTIEANFANGGCLTFVFSSDGTGTAAGWSATISCSFACQDVVPNIASTVPTALPTDTGWIDLCPGDSVVFSGSGVYPQSGMPNGYTQSDATSTFIWDFGDGNLDTAQSATHVYNGNGGWLATLTVIDSNGCRSDTLEQRRVRVSTEPSFSGLVVEDDQLCLGDTTRLIGTATPTQGIFASGGVVTGTTFLPDGNGVAYTTSIIINSFSNNDTITAATDILDICATIEHSFLGDLEIVLTCPNGTSVILKDFPGGGGVFLGQALDDGTNLPGVGWEYCWTNTPTFGTMNAEANGCPNCIGNSLAPGSYATIEPLSNFIGCPLNGTWTLTVIDSLSIDNGYIFSWGMTFNPALFSGLETFTPVLDTMFWQNDPDIVSTVADTAITIVPTTPGFKQYTFTVIDDFGCSFDTTVSVFVQAPPPLPTDTFACAGDSIVLDAGPNFLTYAWSTGATTPAITVTPGTYTLTYTGTICSDSVTINVTEVPLPNIQITGPPFKCVADVQLDAGAGFDSLFWSTGATAQTILVDTGEYTVTAWLNGCFSTATQTVGLLEDSVDILGPDFFCTGDDPVVLSPGSGFSGYLWSTTDTTASISVFNGTYLVTVTQDTCTATSAPFAVVEVPFVPPQITGDPGFCSGLSTVLDVGAGYDSYAWSTGANAQTVTIAVADTITVTVTDSVCVASDTVIVVENPNPAPSIGGNLVYCFDDSTTLNVPAGFATYGWSTGDTTASIFAGTGTYFVQVVDTNGCIGNSDTVQVTNSSPTNAITGLVTVCPGDSIVLRSDTGFATYAWSNGGTADTVYAMAGTITLTATDASGCSVTSTVTVPSGLALEANFSANPEVGLPGEPVSFTDLTTILTDTTTIQGWSWDFGDSIGNSVVQNPTYVFSMIGRYTVVLDVLSDDGCRDTISREFQVLDGVEAVNIITPNGDGFNDFLVFPFLEFLPVSRLEVFNRWGNQVYQTDHYRNNFDGRFLPAGTYFYVLEIPGVQTIRQDLTILK